jgi:hypothetical protein
MSLSEKAFRAVGKLWKWPLLYALITDHVKQIWAADHYDRFNRYSTVEQSGERAFNVIPELANVGVD